MRALCGLVCIFASLPQLGALQVCPSTVILPISRRLFKTIATPSNTGVLSSLRSYRIIKQQTDQWGIEPGQMPTRTQLGMRQQRLKSFVLVLTAEQGEKLMVSLIRTVRRLISA